MLSGILGCGSAKLDIAGTGSWAVFESAGMIEGNGTTTIDVDHGQRITVQLLTEGQLRARVRMAHDETAWRPLLRPLEATEFYIK